MTITSGHNTVCAVTVTYGERAALLRVVLIALLRQNVGKIVIVNNGAEWDVTGMAERLAPDRSEIVNLQTNHGSAAGFAIGIERACSIGAEFIWLLDDDNRPEPGALVTLLDAYTELQETVRKDRLAVLAFRPEHQADVNAGIVISRINPRSSSFWGFHVFDIPYKFWRRTHWGRPHANNILPTAVRLDTAPYSGLLFHRSVIEAHGLPRVDFILYADDTEFTYRITHSGGIIRLVPDARITDLESSWNAKHRFGNSLQSWLSGGSDMRAFYGARNGTYFNRHCRPINKPMFTINRLAYCFGLWLYAKTLRRTNRYRLLSRAIDDGLAGRLGLHPKYPL